jgi:steroid delta-isomerase-like uncharacterized protein
MDRATTVQRLYDRINAHDVDGFGELLADGFIEHEVAPGLEPTKEGAQNLFKQMFAAFPDLRFDVEDTVDGGDKQVVRARVTGTNTGAFMGMPATGKPMSIQAIDILELDDDGLVEEHWGVMDIMSMMQQLGVVPMGPPA